MAAAPAPAVSTTPIVSESMIPLKPIPSLDGAPLPAKHGAVAGNPSMTRVFGLKIKRVIIDAGHGGKDQGTHGPNGLLEKDVVLDVAKRVGTLVQDRLGVEVIYTRDGDTFIPLEQRTQFANEQRGDLFISIHANSSTIRSVTGVEIYVLNFSNSKTDLDTAARENAGAESSVYELESLLQKAMLNDKLKESSEFAGKVLQSMAGPATSKTRSRGVRRAPFVVLIGARMPSILAEIGFISNPADEAMMAKPAQRQKIADALVRGIVDYAQSLSHLQVAEQPVRAATVSSSRQSPSSNKAAQ
jgi:N-acetylmuramoyl-L-alanine amidase